MNTLKLLLLGSVLLPFIAQAVVIYDDDFNGAAGTALYGTTPDITTGGATWFSSAVMQYDGAGNVVSTNGGSAASLTMPTLTGNETINITATIRPYSARNNFIGIGIFNDESGGVGSSELFAFLRGGVNANRPVTVGNVSTLEAGGEVDTTNVASASGGTLSPFVLSLDYNVGTGDYTVSLDAASVYSGNYLPVALADLSHVGFAFNNQDDATLANPGQVQDFSLTVIPEPASHALLGGLVVLAFVATYRRV